MSTGARKRSIRQACTCSCAIAVIAPILVCQSYAAAPPGLLIGRTGIGGLPVTSSYTSAVARFGPSGRDGARSTFTVGGCTLHYPRLGLTLWWAGDPLKRGTPVNCLYFQEAAVSRGGWHTQRGLSIGDPVRKIRKLYPHAYNTQRRGPKWSQKGAIEWDITITCCSGGQRPALFALVKRNHVVALFVAMVGH